MPLARICRISWKSFEITDQELTFLEKISPTFDWKKYTIPPPTLCPDERIRRRLSWRNMYALYNAKCAITGKPIISTYAPNRGYKWTDQETWWSEVEWLDYGREFDFTKSFFDQFGELLKDVPLPCLSNGYVGNENSDYVHGTLNVKDCYLISNATNDEKCEYSETINGSTYVFDSCFVFDSSYCYECIGITRCHNSLYLEESEDCKNIYFSYDCRGCSDCIFCFWLDNQTYCINNEKVSQEEYENFLWNLKLPDGTLDLEKSIPTFEKLKKNSPPNNHIIGSENCTGSFIKFSHNVIEGKNITNMEDSMYVRHMNYSRDCYDCFSWWWGTIGHPWAQNCYECCGIGSGATWLIWCLAVWENTIHVYYSNTCVGCQECFGCVGLRNKKYCIFNKQYTKEKYEITVAKIIEKMIQDHEWGEYPRASISTFAYNETVAFLDFPRTKEEALMEWLWWNDYENPLQKVEKTIPATKLPSEVSKIPDDILNWAILCESTSKPFIINRMELEFYRKIWLPIPRFHPDKRRKRRHGRRK